MDRTIAAVSRAAAKLLKHGTLKAYPRFPHGVATAHPDVIKPAILVFIRR